MCWVGNATVSEREFRSTIRLALKHDVLIDTWTPWGDVNDAVDDIVRSEEPVPKAMIERAWSLYREHAT